mgnify:CR=1 FL=1
MNPNGRFGKRLANEFGGGGTRKHRIEKWRNHLNEIILLLNVSLLVVLAVTLSRADKRFGGGGAGRFVFGIVGVAVAVIVAGCVVVFGRVIVCAVDALPLAWASIWATSGDILAKENVVERLGVVVVVVVVVAAAAVVEFDTELLREELLLVADDILFEIVDDES